MDIIRSPLLHTQPRRSDSMGHGDYGMPRGERKHKGFDLVADAGTAVTAPTDGKITKLGYPYASNLKFRYVEITGETYRWRLMYVRPSEGITVGDRVEQGDIIGSAQDIAGYHGGGMKNHIHIECYKNGLLTDPEPLIL